ncbi:MAG: glycosyltransferase [Acidobacteria bacterium]|nr:glycosyltransferase [Acidobacteriota bacterium]
MRLGAVIIGFNSAAQIGACLDSCLRYSSEFPAGIVVIDNASTDETAPLARREGVNVVVNCANRGFAAAVNQGFHLLADAEAVLVLNPDVVLLSSPAVLARELADPRTGAVAGMLLGSDGRPQAGFQARRFPTAAALAFESLGLNRLWAGNPVNRHYRCLDLNPRLPAAVEQPPAACLLIRRAAWLQVGGFDEGYFPVWFEDVDFLERLAAAGWIARYTPIFQARHAGGHSVSSVGWGTRQLYWYGSLLRYISRRFRAPARWLVGGCVVVGLVPRTVTGMFLQRSIQPLLVCDKVMRLAGVYLWNGRAAARLQERRRQAVEECGPSAL